MRLFVHPIAVQTCFARFLVVVTAFMMLYGTTAEAANTIAGNGSEQSLTISTGLHVGDNDSADYHHHDGQNNSEKGDQHGLCAQSHCHHNAFSGYDASLKFSLAELHKLYFELNENMLPSAQIDGLKRPPRV